MFYWVGNKLHEDSGLAMMNKFLVAQQSRAAVTNISELMDHQCPADHRLATVGLGYAEHSIYGKGQVLHYNSYH